MVTSRYRCIAVTKILRPGGWICWIQAFIFVNMELLGASLVPRRSKKDVVSFFGLRSRLERSEIET
jgi:hypothetical protein